MAGYIPAIFIYGPPIQISTILPYVYDITVFQSKRLLKSKLL